MTPGGYNQNVQLLQTPDLRRAAQRDEPQLPDHPARWACPCRVAAVDGRLARPLGRRHAGRHHEELPPRDELQVGADGRVPDADRAVYPDGRGHAAVSGHHRRSDGLDDTPWTYEIPMRWNDQPLFEYACHEGNYGLVQHLGWRARAQEAAAEAAMAFRSRLGEHQQVCDEEKQTMTQRTGDGGDGGGDGRGDTGCSAVGPVSGGRGRTNAVGASGSAGRVGLPDTDPARASRRARRTRPS